MRQLGLLALGFALISCDNNRNVNVSNSNAQGTVGGQVLDVSGEAPLKGAMVTINSAGGNFTAPTDENGFYSIGKVPVGSFFVTIAQQGYQSAYFPGTLAGSVGNFPVSNPISTQPTVELFKADTTMTVSIVDDRGNPLSGIAATARSQVRYFAYATTSSSSVPALTAFGTYSVTATTDAMGVATFKGLPNTFALDMLGAATTQVLVDVAPTTVMGSTTYQWAGGSFPFNPSRPGNNTFTIPLVGPSTALTVNQSSIDYLVGPAGPQTSFSTSVGSLLPVDKPISITFNQAVDQKTLRAQLLDEAGNSLGNLSPTFTAGNVVQLAPPMGGFSPGVRLNLLLHAQPLSLAGSQNVTPFDVAAPFFTPNSATFGVTAKLQTVKVKAPPYGSTGVIATLTFTEPVGLGKAAIAPWGGALPGIGLPCIAWYENSIDLDKSGGTATYQGEYPGAGVTLPVCPNTANPPQPSGGPIDVTKIYSGEVVANGVSPTPPITGFAKVWYVLLDPDFAAPATANGCASRDSTGAALAACTKPSSASTLHLLFSTQSGAGTFKRVNGQPVPDLHSIAFTQ
jgi:hypothetical protein